MSLIQQLADDLLGWLSAGAGGIGRRVLLWLDPQRDFQRLVEPLEAALGDRARLARLGPGGLTTQVALKLTLLRAESEAGAPVIVYLPGLDRADVEPRRDGSTPRLWSVYDYRFKGCIWGRGERWEPGSVPELPTLYSWLRQHGAKVVDEATRRRITAGGADSLLARYAERQQAISVADWPQPLRLSDVEAALAGDWRESLRRLLAAPNNEVKRWGSEKATVLSHISAELGLKGLDTDLEPDALADNAAINLALVEAWDALGRPPGFPYIGRLPDGAEQRLKQVAFVRDDLLSHADLGPRFLERVKRLEPSYPLADWAKGREGLPGALPRLAERRWQQFLEQLSAAARIGWRDAAELLLQHKEALTSAAAVPWHSLYSELRWDTAAGLADLVMEADRILHEAEELTSASDCVKAYADDWWKLDALHLQVLAGAAEAHLEAVRGVAERVYFDCASRLADRFFDFVEAEGKWPPAGIPDVGALASKVWSSAGQRYAVLITDACRWDIARTLKDQLDDGEVTLTAVAATLPTVTPFGMAALLPLGEEPIQVDVSDGKLDIRQGDDKDLDSRDGRKAFLKNRIVDATGRSEVEFLDLDDLLKGAKVPAARAVVVFDNGLDEQGHKGTDQLPGLVPAFVRNLRRGIQLLHEAGFSTVHMLTDHGFLLVAPELADALGRPSVLPGQAYYKHERWCALKPEAPVNDVLHLPAPLAPGLMLGIPKGFRTLTKAEPFLHGGISLQECVIPHLVSSRALPRSELDLDLSVSTDRLSGGTVPVILRPKLGGGQGLLGGAEPITLRVWVETTDGRVVAGPKEEELRPEVEEIKPSLYLREGSNLSAGDELMLRARQIPSERDLGSVSLTLLVDWE